MPASFIQRFSKKRSRAKKYLKLGCTTDTAPTDRDSTTTIETGVGRESRDAIEVDLRVPQNHLIINSIPHTIEAESSSDGDNISYDLGCDSSDNSKQLSYGSSQDDDLSVSDNDHSVTGTSTGTCQSFDDILLSDCASIASYDTILRREQRNPEGVKYGDSIMRRGNFSHRDMGYLYQSSSGESIESGSQQMYEYARSQSMCSQRNRQEIDFSVKLRDEEENISFDKYDLESPSESITEFQTDSIHDFDVNSDWVTSDPRETRIANVKGRAICDKKNMFPAGKDDDSTGDHTSKESNTDLVRTRGLWAKNRLKMRVSIPSQFVRTFPVQRIIKKKKNQAREVICRHNESFQKLITRFANDARQRKKEKEELKEKKSRIVIIPSDHPFKILWDVFTILLTFISAYITHQNIRDRRYESTMFANFTEAWFILDIMLNFITAHRHSDGTVICNGSAVWGRYLTTWFPIDLLALIRWEGMFLKPIIEQQNKRNLVTKWFFRSKATVRVTKILRGRHFKIFGRIVNSTKKIGVGGRRLLALIIKYLPKYILFYRNMKGVLVLKVLRQIHFGRKVAKGLTMHNSKKDEDETRDNHDLRIHAHPDDVGGYAVQDDNSICEY